MPRISSGGLGKFGPLAVRELGEALDHAFLLEVDRDGAAARAVDRRSGTQSMATTCFAPSISAARSANWPTGQHLLVGEAVRNLHRGHVGVRHAHVLGVPAGIAAAVPWPKSSSARSLLRWVRSQTDQLPRRHWSHSPHAGHEAVEQMQVRAADRAGILPAQRFHGSSRKNSPTRTSP